MASFNLGTFARSSVKEGQHSDNEVKLSTFQTATVSTSIGESKPNGTVLPSLNTNSSSSPLATAGTRPKTLRTQLAADGSTKTTIFPLKAKSNTSSVQMSSMKLGSAMPSLITQMPSFSNKRTPLFGVATPGKRTAPETTLTSSTRPSNKLAPQKQFSLSSMPPLSPNSKWRIVSQKMQIGAAKQKKSSLLDVIKLARAYQKAAAGIAMKDISTKQQSENLMSKIDKRKIAVMLLSCMIEADFPKEFYEQMVQSKQILNIVRSFVNSSNDTKKLLVELCEETEDLGIIEACKINIASGGVEEDTDLTSSSCTSKTTTDNDVKLDLGE